MKNVRNAVVLSAASLLLVACLAYAEERFGIRVYEGARYEAALSKTVSDMMSMDAHCHSTGDSVSKVVEFYRKQPGLKLIGSATPEGALFKRCAEVLNEYTRMKTDRCDLDVTIQSPWQDIGTGRRNQSTLITFAKREE